MIEMSLYKNIKLIKSVINSEMNCYNHIFGGKAFSQKRTWRVLEVTTTKRCGLRAWAQQT